MKLCNLDYLRNISPDDNSFAIRIIRLFLEDTPLAMTGIREALVVSDWAKLHTLAHRIKPSVQIIGMQKELADALLKINEYSKHGKETDRIPDLVDYFETHLNQVYGELREALVELGTHEKTDA